MDTMTDPTYRRWAHRELARHEKWLAGDWDSRSTRGCDAAARHRAEVKRLRAFLATCRNCGDPLYGGPIRIHHHSENGIDVTRGPA